MAIKRPSLKMHKTTMWVFLAIVAVFVVITLIALEKSADRHGRKLMPGKEGMESRKNKQ